MHKFFLILLVSVTFSVGCAPQRTTSTAGLEQAKTEANQARLLKSQPPVSLSFSLERANINKRTELWNDSAKVSYIYLVDYGRIMAFYVIKGKVSSVNSQITNPDQIVRNSNLQAGQYSVISSPAEDGSYGTNGDAIFFFTTSGAYVEWAGNYMLSDHQLKLSQPPVTTLIVKE